MMIVLGRHPHKEQLLFVGIKCLTFNFVTMVLNDQLIRRVLMLRNWSTRWI